MLSGNPGAPRMIRAEENVMVSWANAEADARHATSAAASMRFESFIGNQREMELVVERRQKIRKEGENWYIQISMTGRPWVADNHRR
jgi:hypothetical protein